MFEEGYDCSIQLFGEWIEAKNDSYFGKCRNMYDVLRYSRYRMIDNVLKEKKITIEQLGFVKE